jgi:hypothetical protein
MGFEFPGVLLFLLFDSIDDFLLNLGDLSVSLDFGFDLLELDFKILGLLSISKLRLLLLKSGNSSFGNIESSGMISKLGSNNLSLLLEDHLEFLHVFGAFLVVSNHL